MIPCIDKKDGSIIMDNRCSTMRELVKENSRYMNGAMLSGCYLSCAMLPYSNFAGANLEDALLADADFTGASLRDASLYNASLTGCNMAHADLEGADMRLATLCDANLDGAAISYRGSRAIIRFEVT